VLKQFYTLSKEDAYSATVRCSVEQVPEVMAKLDHLGYTSVTPIYWHKVNTKKHSKPGWVNVVQVYVQGFSRTGGYKRYVPPESAEDRINVLTGPGPAKLTCYKTGANIGCPINPNESPRWLIRKLLAHVMRPGDTVLIAGTGAGGDVLGCVEAGWGCTGVESDAGQFHELCFSHNGPPIRNLMSNKELICNPLKFIITQNKSPTRVNILKNCCFCDPSLILLPNLPR